MMTLICLIAVLCIMFWGAEFGAVVAYLAFAFYINLAIDSVMPWRDIGVSGLQLIFVFLALSRYDTQIASFGIWLTVCAMLGLLAVFVSGKEV